MEKTLSSELHHEGGPKQKIIEAIRSGDIDTLDSLLVELNTRLTGYKQAHFADNATDRRREILEKFLKNAGKGYASEVVYLGDGGLSRLAMSVNGDDVQIKPTHNSTKKVMKEWEKLQ